MSATSVSVKLPDLSLIFESFTVQLLLPFQYMFFLVVIMAAEIAAAVFVLIFRKKV